MLLSGTVVWYYLPRSQELWKSVSQYQMQSENFWQQLKPFLSHVFIVW